MVESEKVYTPKEVVLDPTKTQRLPDRKAHGDPDLVFGTPSNPGNPPVIYETEEEATEAAAAEARAAGVSPNAVMARWKGGYTTGTTGAEPQ